MISLKYTSYVAQSFGLSVSPDKHNDVGRVLTVVTVNNRADIRRPETDCETSSLEEELRMVQIQRRLCKKAIPSKPIRNESNLQ